jgi:hypothetical protein
MLGHRSATLTLDLYGHLFADQLGEVADAPVRSGSQRFAAVRSGSQRFATLRPICGQMALRKGPTNVT